MDQHRIDTHNATELYLQRATREHAVGVILSLAAWPVLDRVRNAGIFLAALDALTVKHGEFGSGWVWRLGLWLTRKAVRPWKPTWNDYWLLYWLLTKDHPEVASTALAELHLRAFHMIRHPEYTRHHAIEWAFSSDCALSLLKRECEQHPEFRRAMLAYIAATNCRAHRELGFPERGAAVS